MTTQPIYHTEAEETNIVMLTIIRANWRTRFKWAMRLVFGDFLFIQGKRSAFLIASDAYEVAEEDTQ